MSSWINIDEDSKGIVTIFLKGDWDEAVVNGLSDKRWKRVAINGVSWPDYTGLLPYASQIIEICVPFGPDSSRGFEGLHELKSIVVTDVMRPTVDYRVFSQLADLEVLWDKKKPHYFANENVETLFIHQVSGDDLSWLPEKNSLTRIELRAGRLVSLRGIERAKNLRELVVDELKACVDVESVLGMTSLHSVRLDAPRAMIEGIEWLARMPDMHSAEVYGKVVSVDWAVIAAHPKLRKFGVSLQQDNADPDDEIKKILTSLGKSIKEFVRYKGKNAGFYIEFS